MSAQYQLAGRPEDAADGALGEEAGLASPCYCTFAGGADGGGTDGTPAAAGKAGTGGYRLPTEGSIDPGAASTARPWAAEGWAPTASASLCALCP